MYLPALAALNIAVLFVATALGKSPPTPRSQGGCAPPSSRTACESESGAVVPSHRRLWAVPPRWLSIRNGAPHRTRVATLGGGGGSVGATIGSIGGLHERLAGEGQSLAQRSRARAGPRLPRGAAVPPQDGSSALLPPGTPAARHALATVVAGGVLVVDTNGASDVPDVSISAP
jgi:hypothetical protein